MINNQNKFRSPENSTSSPLLRASCMNYHMQLPIKLMLPAKTDASRQLEEFSQTGTNSLNVP